ncbi:MAG: GntR family transcriptional regulator, partial [Chloroflexota bacterium]
MNLQTDYPRLGRPSLRDEALDVIRDAILSGKLKAGERIAESELAKQMGISRAPIREALSWLEQEGMVTNVAHRGFFVVDMLEEEIEQAYQIRALLVGFAIRTAVQRVTPAGIQRLQACIDGMATAAGERNIDALIEHDMRFHREIIGL